MEKLVDLVEEECIPCNSDMTPLTPVEYEPYMAQLEDWIIEEEKMLVKTWRFRNFEIPMDFANKITVIAEAAGHHPWKSARGLTRSLGAACGLGAGDGQAGVPSSCHPHQRPQPRSARLSGPQPPEPRFDSQCSSP